MVGDEQDRDEPEADPDIDDLDATDAAEQHLTDLHPDSAADQQVQDQADERAWVDTCLTAITTALAADVLCSDVVRSALDSLAITAAARVSRILRSDQRRGTI